MHCEASRIIPKQIEQRNCDNKESSACTNNPSSQPASVASVPDDAMARREDSYGAGERREEEEEEEEDSQKNERKREKEDRLD